MADVKKAESVVSSVGVDMDSLEFDVNTNLAASPGKATTPSLQELIEAELSARLCQPDSLEPPPSPTFNSLLSCDSIEPVPAPSTAPIPSAPALSLDSLAELDPLKEPLGPADDESGIDLLSPTKLADLSNPDSLESSPDLLPTSSPSHESHSTENFLLLSDLPVPHSQQETIPPGEAPLLIMGDNIMGDDIMSSPLETQNCVYTQSYTQHTQIFGVCDTETQDISSNVEQQPDLLLITTSDSNELNAESFTKNGSDHPALSESPWEVCDPTPLNPSEQPQWDSDPHISSGDWDAGGQATAISDPILATSDQVFPTPSSSTSPLPPSPRSGALTPSSTKSVCGDSEGGSVEIGGDSEGGVDEHIEGDMEERIEEGGVEQIEGGVEECIEVDVKECDEGDGVVEELIEGGGSGGVEECDGSEARGQDVTLVPHTNMEYEDEDDDFWSSMKKNDDDDDENDNYTSSRRYQKEEYIEEKEQYTEKEEYQMEEEEEEEEKETKYEMKYSAKIEEEDMKVKEEDDIEDEGMNYGDDDDDELISRRFIKKKQTPAENGVAKPADPPAPEDKKKQQQQPKEEKPVEEKKKKTENGVANVDNAGEEKKKKKKSRSSEDGEKSKKKKKKKKDSEKENKDSSTSSGSESEEEPAIPPTPPLFNGRALTNGHSHCNHELEPKKNDIQQLTEEKWMKEETQLIREQINSEVLNKEEALFQEESFTKEDFSSLVDTYNNKQEIDNKQEDARPQSSLSDQDDLSGVNVKKLTVSYLTVAQSITKAEANNHKSDAKPEIRSDLNTSVNISSLVDSYSSPPPRASTPSKRPDDITPVSFRSLKSAYEATAAGASGAGSRHSSSGSSSPAGGSPAPKEELNISLHQLREEYCRSVEDGYSRSHTPSRAPPETGVSIRHLKAAYQSRDDILEKHVGPRIRSFDASKMKSKFEKPKQVSQLPSECRQCGKQVFQMERIVAEKASWHKNCFRCKECNTILTLETYQSHEGVLYCKPHFKELFRPKAVIEDEEEQRRERSTDKPDYGLEELSTANLKQKFKMFEQISTEEERQLEPIPVRRSHSLLSKAARFMQSEDGEYGIENSELGEYEYDEDDEDEDEEEDEEEEGEDGEKIKKKKGRPTSFSGLQDLKAGFARKNRREEMSKQRREELSKFRQMLCAGKNITTREMFESGNFDEDGKLKRKEQIKIDGCPAAKNLRERFEKGMSVNEEDEDNDERKEVDSVFRKAETASKARNLFKEIDTAVVEGNEPVMRPRSSAQARRENRLSRDGIDVEERELGRDPNLIKCTDNYEDEIDCRGTRDILAKFRKLEMQTEREERGPRPLKRFTPPPGGEEEYDSDEEYSDDEYSDEEEESEEEDEEEEEEEEGGKPKYKDEILEMINSSQSARKAASLRAKFEKWESEVERNNEYNQNEKNQDDEEECMPSIDTARNLRAMFENKAQEASRPVTERPKPKVNRFVGGGGDKCISCDQTVYAMEKLEVAARVLHKNCFKCCKCSTKLSMNSFSIGGNDMYCTTHYKQAFTEKGTYDVFTPNKGKWTRKIEATNSESPKSQE